MTSAAWKVSVCGSAAAGAEEGEGAGAGSGWRVAWGGDGSCCCFFFLNINQVEEVERGKKKKEV